jgi:hypothetical protein
MNKQQSCKRSLLKNLFIGKSFHVVILLIFLGGSNFSFGQTETRTTMTSSNTSGSWEKSKLETLKADNPELYVVYTKILTLDQEIRNVVVQNQLPSHLLDKYLINVGTICSDCLDNKLLVASRVFVHINNPSSSNALLLYMEEFLTNLTNQ